MIEMKRVVWLAVPIVLLSGCQNTIEGAKEDADAAGIKIREGAAVAKEHLDETKVKVDATVDAAKAKATETVERMKTEGPKALEQAKGKMGEEAARMGDAVREKVQQKTNKAMGKMGEAASSAAQETVQSAVEGIQGKN
jgi:predicted small secreted protein